MSKFNLTKPLVALAAAALATTALASPALAQQVPADLTVMPVAATPYKAKRTPWGDPDLRGMWPIDQIAQTPRQRPVAMGTRALLTDAEYEAALKSAREQLSMGDRQDKVGILGMGHWAERGLPLRQTSLIVEPANGRRPAGTTKRST